MILRFACVHLASAPREVALRGLVKPSGVTCRRPPSRRMSRTPPAVRVATGEERATRRGAASRLVSSLASRASPRGLDGPRGGTARNDVEPHEAEERRGRRSAPEAARCREPADRESSSDAPGRAGRSTNHFIRRSASRERSEPPRRRRYAGARCARSCARDLLDGHHAPHASAASITISAPSRRSGSEPSRFERSIGKQPVPAARRARSPGRPRKSLTGRRRNRGALGDADEAAAASTTATGPAVYRSKNSSYARAESSSAGW